jgi:hypothetical protein
MRITILKRFSLMASASVLCLTLSYVTFDQKARAQEAAPKSVPELLSAMKLTKAQQADLKAQ